MKHRETHPDLDVPGCFACRIAHVAVSASATPTRREVSHLNAKEKAWSKDMDAYKRIRKSGGQPTQIDGSAKIEKTAD